MLSGYWVALIAARALLGRLLLKVSALALIPLMATVAGAALAVVTVAPGFLMAAVSLLVAGFALAGVTPTIPGVGGAAFPERTGTVFGVLFSLSVIGAMTLPWIGGHLAAALGVRVIMALGAAACLVVMLLALVARRVGRA